VSCKRLDAGSVIFASVSPPDYSTRIRPHASFNGRRFSRRSSQPLDGKAAQNWRDHGVTFEMARDAFGDPFAIEWTEEAQDPHEERYAMIGMVENRLLFVACTMRKERTHVISARKAEPYERRKYHEENREA
jgi:hypothetical protein